MDVQWSLLLARYGEPWRLRRKIVDRSFRPASLAAYQALQEKRARVLATRLLQNPQEWTAHVELSEFFPISSILRLSAIIHIIFPVSKANKCLP
jgi:cytochrome P450